MHTRDRERQAEPRIVIEREAQRRPEAPVAVDRAHESFAAVLHTFTTVARVESRRLRVWHQEAKLHLPAGDRRLADVANDEPRLLMVRGHHSRDVRTLDVRVGVAEAEVLDVTAKLPLQRAALALAEQVRLVEADEA